MPKFSRRWKSALAVAGLLVFVSFNGVAFMHARRMTHYLEGNERTESPEDLGLGAKLWTVLTGVRIPRPRNRSDPGAAGLDFETVTFETRDSIGIEAWYLPAPRATDLVILFHGYAAAKQSLLGEARAFLGMDLSVLMVDFRGSGGSSGDVTSIGWHEAQDVAAAIRFARAAYQPRRILLFGTSMGAVAILRAMHVEPIAPDALILEAPFNRMLDTTVNRFHRMGLPSFPSARLLLFWGGRQQGFDAFEHNPESYVASVGCPTLLLFGADDRDVTVDDALTFRSSARPNSQHHIFEDVGHPPLLPQAREEWTGRVRSFIARLEGDGEGG